MLLGLTVVIKLALAKRLPKDTCPLAELGLGFPEPRELLWATSWVNTVKGGGTRLGTGAAGPKRLVVEPNPIEGLGVLVCCAFAFVLAVCRLSDDTVKFNEGLKRRETVTGP